MTELIVLRYGEHEVAFDPAVRMWSLTAMYEASGSPKNKEPKFWLRNTQTQELITALLEREKVSGTHLLGVEKVSGTHLLETRQGRAGGTWAHWQLAAAYAHYLDPDFYLTWNEWAMAHYVASAAFERPTPLSPSLDTLSREVAQLAAQIAQLQREQRQQRSLLSSRAADDIALAIIAILGESGVPRTPSEVTRALHHAGYDTLSQTRIRVRMRRMAARGQIAKVAHSLYAAVSSSPLTPTDMDASVEQAPTRAVG